MLLLVSVTLLNLQRFSLFLFFNNFKKSCIRSLCLVKGIVFSKWSCFKHVFANLNSPYTVTSYRWELTWIETKTFLGIWSTNLDNNGSKFLLNNRLHSFNGLNINKTLYENSLWKFINQISRLNMKSASLSKIHHNSAHTFANLFHCHRISTIRFLKCIASYFEKFLKIFFPWHATSKNYWRTIAFNYVWPF